MKRFGFNLLLSILVHSLIIILVMTCGLKESGKSVTGTSPDPALFYSLLRMYIQPVRVPTFLILRM